MRELGQASLPSSPETERGPPMRSFSLGARSIDESCHWFHGKISRQDAEEVLREAGGRDGLYLVRKSTSSEGDYALSVVHNGCVAHYQIRRNGDDAFFSVGDQGVVIHGLEELIRHYEDGRGLVSPLTEMCKGQPPPPDVRRHGRTNLLHRAIAGGNFDIVKRLLESNYNVDAKNQDGQTALHLASLSGREDFVLALLDAGASTHCVDGSGHTPLHYACREGHLKCVDYLLDHGASTTIPALGTRWVAMHFAAYKGNIDMVQLLFDCQAACRPRSADNLLPQDLVPRNAPELVDLLLSRKDPVENRLHREDWFHGDLSRDEANARLKMAPDGSFLFRTSKKAENKLVLSMNFEGYTYHFELHRQDRYYFIDDGPLLDGLEALIWHYSKHKDGLHCALTSPVQPVVSPVIRMSPWRQTTPTLPSVPGGHFGIASLIPKEQLELGESIGEGEFGSVLRGVWRRRNGSTAVAIKTLREEHSTQEKRAGFVREVEMMLNLDHGCIVKLLGVCLGPPLMMVQELVPLGSLLNYVKSNPESIDLDKDFPRWSRQIAEGMSYLETEQLVHRDLAARNILLASRMQAKISDFGLSRALQLGDDYYKATTGGKWPLRWYAPESINFGTFNTASDVWSYGVTLWEMYSFGKPPYGNMTGLQVLEFVERGSRLSQPQACPEWCYEIMLGCWSLSPEDRPTFRTMAQKFRENITSSNVVIV